MRSLAPGLRVAEARQRFFGLEVGARMTVMELEGGVLVHSPIALDPSAVGARWVLAPNLLHHLHVGPWIDAGAEAWAAPGLPEKRKDMRFAGVIEDDRHPFGPQIAVLPLRCFALTNEVAVLHRPSRTLVLTDLVFHFGPAAPLLTRAAMACACAWPGCRASALERVGMRRDLARREIGELLTWDFDRLVMAHGDVIETGGREALASAYRWLRPAADPAIP